ncbi:hypothetical protein RY831_17515 [Noviherbaspirillum sp. CPCC 100848]|uniref:Uncharacterized protein n=1 Tax=Noviherbaspirillum album TaxID=3080276 RepID=A0ABU6JBE2_9BURK|nr:hypothetical protein [Noviherbaspirillum sp. CPCC 100848]MEC4720968.1 hypothetical protein [Noviherbaspirillum sp. CPCC 100848]
MGSILIDVPDFLDSELIYNDKESRQILKFFWPHSSEKINSLSINNDTRRLAQSALVTAIDGSYAMGFIQALGESIARPGSGIKPLTKKLAQRFIKHWWIHATQRDLEDAKVYESVRSSIARNLRSRFEFVVQGISLKSRNAPFYATNSRVDILWA